MITLLFVTFNKYTFSFFAAKFILQKRKMEQVEKWKKNYLI